MSNEEYTHQDFWKQRTWLERMEQRMLNKHLENAEVMFELALNSQDIEAAFGWAKIKSRYDIQQIIDKHLFFEMFTRYGFLELNTTN